MKISNFSSGESIYQASFQQKIIRKKFRKKLSIKFGFLALFAFTSFFIYSCSCGSNTGPAPMVETNPSDAFLLSLEAGTGSFSPTFVSNFYQYTLIMAPGTTSISLTPTPSAGATLSYILNDSATNTTVLNNMTNGSSNKYSIKVISEDESATNDYEIDMIVLTIQILLQKLTASDAASDKNFGISVSMSENTAIIGAYRDNDAGDNSGSAYIFVRNGTNWSQQAKLTADDAATNDNFGISVSVSEDTAIIGAYRDSDAGDNSGSAYIFVRDGTNWTQQAKLTADDAATNDNFGWSISLNESENTVVVGAYQNDDHGDDSGSAYIFVRNGTNWTQQAKLTADDAASGHFFGGSVNISGETVVIGANQNDGGSAYIFVRNGTNWTQQTKLIANDAASSDNFGGSVSVSGDTALIGAIRNNDNGFYSGSAYIFVRNNINWSQQAKLTASDASTNDNFGISVSVSGETAIIGAYLNDGGSAYIFVRDGTNWSQLEKLTTDASTNDNFGISVSVSGGTVIIGADRNDDAETDSGSAYILDIP